MSRYILVHGAWHGAWCWDRVIPRLDAAGHDVSTPTLAGTGERASEINGVAGLQTHVDDVIRELESHSGSDCVVVGHSYAGLVVRQAVDQVQGFTGHVVLIDGWAGPNGASMFSLAPSWFVDGLRKLAADAGDPGVMPPPTAAMVGVDQPEDVAWLQQRLTPHPINTFEEPTRLTGTIELVGGSAIVCEPRLLPFVDFAKQLGYRVRPLASGHDAMVCRPEALAAMLLDEGSIGPEIPPVR